MIWNVEYDYFGNREWVAYIDGSGVYRIIQRLKNDKIIYVEASSSELWIDKYSTYREEWFNLEDAKYEMYRSYINRI